MHPNLKMLIAVATQLGPLRDDVVFVGGATVSLFLTDPAAPNVRSTGDVDLIVEISTQMDYYRFGMELRNVGFVEDVDSPILGRWVVDGIQIDIMPTESRILGITNRWYAEAMVTAEPYTLQADLPIRLIRPELFIGTKVEAFLGRGQGDFLGSRDMEDIIAVVDGRPELISEVDRSSSGIKGALAAQFRSWLEFPAFLESIAGHLPPDAASQSRQPMVIERLRRIAALSD